MQTPRSRRPHYSDIDPLQTYEDANSLIFTNAYFIQNLIEDTSLTHDYRTLNETLRMFPSVRLSEYSDRDPL